MESRHSFCEANGKGGKTWQEPGEVGWRAGGDSESVCRAISRWGGLSLRGESSLGRRCSFGGVEGRRGRTAGPWQP